MVRYACLILFTLVLTGCTGTQENEEKGQPFEGTPITVPEIAPETIGDMRIAIVSRDKTTGGKIKVILINHSNRTYLVSEDNLLPRSEVPPSSLRYKTSFLTFDSNTQLSILEDDLMAKMEGLLQTYNFYGIATPCSVEQIQNPQWPERDTIVVEKNGRLYALTREEKLVDKNRVQTEAGKIYRTLKYNILLMRQEGYHPMYIEQRIGR